VTTQGGHPVDGVSRADSGPGPAGDGRRGGLRSAANGVRWWFASVMGDNAYRRYVDHLARHHPDDPVPTEKQYWRDRYAAMDSNPGARCC
jgi:uncharacterized short protein YbdD (DUF466 family)